MSDDPVQATLAGIQASQARIEANLAKLRVDLMERMDRLQHRIDGFDEHLTMGLGHADRVEKRSHAVSEDNRLLAEQLMSLTRLLRRLEGRITDLENRRDTH